MNTILHLYQEIHPLIVQMQGQSHTTYYLKHISCDHHILFKSCTHNFDFAYL